MNVVFVSAADLTRTKPGGVRVYVKNLIKNLLEKEVQITFIGISYSKENNYPNLPYRYVSVVSAEKIPSYKFLFNLFFKIPFIKIEKDAIIHAQRPDNLFPFVVFHRKNKKICTLHGNPLKSFYKKKKFIALFYELIEKISLKSVDKIIAVDEDTKNFYSLKYPPLKEKIITIPVGIDIEKLKPIDKDVRKEYHLLKGEKIILFVGRLEFEKNLSFLINSFTLVKEKIQSAKLVLVGDGREKSKLENLVKELNLENSVVFFGTIEHEKIAEIMNCADVFVLTSLYEGSPTVIKECLSCGIPVVSFNVGDVSTIIKNGVNGFIVEERDERRFAEKLIEVFNSKKDWKDDCRNSVVQYSWNNIAEKILKVYKGV